jgi:hypothetical protein
LELSAYVEKEKTKETLICCFTNYLDVLPHSGLGPYVEKEGVKRKKL